MKFRSRRGGDPADERQQGQVIGASLRRIYDDALSEPLPSEFKDLLDSLD